MFGNVTGSQFISDTIMDCNQYVAEALFSKSYLYNRLNQAIFWILNYRKWYWNIQVDALWDWATELSTYNLTYRPKLIEFVKSETKPYKKVTTMTNTEKDTNKSWFTNNWAALVLWEPISKVYVQYEKYFTLFTESTKDNELPIPPEYNEALTKKFLSMIAWVWLWEGSWQLMSIYKSDALESLNQLSKTDSYDNPVDYLTSPRYSNNWAV